MENSQASYNSDSGFYIGQTPKQTTPERSIVRNVKSFGNVLGFSGTNMRYVTITKSQWFNNGTGIVPNALDTEKYAPPEDNVITDNDIFWNNFNYYAGAPFKLKKQATSAPVPGRRRRPALRRSPRRGQPTTASTATTWSGSGALKQILLKQADAADLIGNQVHDNQFGLGGADLNGRELFYDGSGSDNCFGPNVGVDDDDARPTARPSPRARSPGANTFNQAAQDEAINWSVGDPTHEAFWIRHPHAAKAGLTPLEHYKK